ncbi:MAG: hypothetical protein QF814_05555 [Candidatus Marinimicrobia bacterium]|jgi:hypothetical protein|nr:hypothetical protein [Candidatus Neomarinimicrobiota bacterium]HJM48006.1 hypothetical protein [Candidatus Neomarinimicrobiota bacterium]
MNIGLFIKDFEFGIKISEKLSEFELSFDFCDTHSDIMDETHLIIVDLDDINNGDVHFIRQLYGKNNNARIIGFMKQVQKDQHTIFKNAGCNMILPKSSLIKNIETFIDD